MTAAGNSQRLPRRMRNTSGGKMLVREMVFGRNGELTLGKQQGLDRSAEYFNEQLEWPY